MEVFDQQQIAEHVDTPRVNVVRLSIIYFGVIGLVSLIGFGVYAWLWGGDGVTPRDVRYSGVQVTDIPPAPELSPEALRARENAALIQQQFEERGDRDRDGLTDEQEGELGTNPDDLDTDADGVDDYVEVSITHTDPLNGDTDGDGIGDREDEVDDRPQL